MLSEKSDLGHAWLREITAAIAAMALSFLGATCVLHLWDAHLHVPFLYSADANLHLMIVKGILDNGWFLTNSHLAAPYGQELYDFPVVNGDHLDVLLIKFLGLLTRDPAAVMNVFFMLTFPLVALVSYAVFRRFAIGRLSSVACSTLYALLPYHFLRGEGHLLLSAYFAVPLGCFLVLSVIRGESLFLQNRRASSRVRRFATKATLTTVAACVLVALASGSFYYSGFTVVLVLLAALLRAIADRKKSALIAGSGVAALILAVAVAQLTPTIWYHHQHGANPLVGQRQDWESEYYSLKLTQLVLPLPGNRVHFLARVRAHYDRWRVGPQTEAVVATLGAVATVGFFASIIALLVAPLTRYRRPPNELLTATGLAVLLAFLTATMGGLSSLIAFLFAGLRSWNRLSIFIAFFSLMGVAVGLDWLGRRLAARAASRALAVGLVMLVVAFGVLEQTTDYFGIPYAGVKQQWDADAAFVRQIEQRLPRNSSVFELPYASFPESAPPPPGHEVVYDAVRPYLHSSGLKWSFGAPRGRPADWARRIANRPVESVLRSIAAIGFAGIYVDRDGYLDNGRRAVATLSKALAAKPLRSADGRFLFFSLAEYEQKLRQRLSPRQIHLKCVHTLGAQGAEHCLP
jgi:hypothetical protein